MDLSRRSLITNGKLFIQISNSFSNHWPKTEKYSNELRGVDIGQSLMCYISMDLSRHALQSYELIDFFFKFRNHFSN